MKVKNHIENEYAAGCARVSCGCVAYHGALQYYALQTQQFNTIYLHSDKRFRPFVIDGVAYEYHPLKFTYNVVISKDPEGNPIAVTSLSQTVVDCIRHIDLAGGLEELLYALASISYGQLKEKDISLFLAGHASMVNEQLIEYGAEELIHQGVVRQRLTEALDAGGIREPYPLEEREASPDQPAESFKWKYGKHSERYKKPG